MKFLYTMKSKFIATVVVFSVISISGISQVSSLSPYSRFGIGDIHRQGSTYNLSMGGAGYAIIDPYQINLLNPATYSYLANTTFQVGIRAQLLQLDNGTAKQTLGSGNLNFGSMIMKRAGSKWAFGFGLVPYSTSGYLITETVEDENVGEVKYSYDGSGGINKSYLGVSRRLEAKNWIYFKDKAGNRIDSAQVIKHSLSFGLHANYYFGNLKQQRKVNIADPTFLDMRINNNTQVKDLGADLGVYYQTILSSAYTSDRRLKKKWLIGVGATYSPSLEMATKFTELRQSTQIINNIETALDTSFYSEGSGRTIIPAKIGGGVALSYAGQKGRQWTWSVQYQTQNWEDYRRFIEDAEQPNNLTKSSELAFGMRFAPSTLEDASNALARGTYMLGARSTATGFLLSGNQILEQAVSMGFTFPMLGSKSASRFNLGMELGQRGTTTDGLIKEQFRNIYVGFSFSPYFKNVWFVERKYD
jgi:hypothetical protein